MSTHRKTWSKSEKLAAIHMANTEGMANASRHFNVSQTSTYNWKALASLLWKTVVVTS
jgi:transposase-like protein